MDVGVANDATVLTNLGEKMSDDEVDELLKAVDTSSGEINYTGEYTRAQRPSARHHSIQANLSELVRTILAN